jgi:hypothetical protein
MMAKGSNPQGYPHKVCTYAARDLAPETFLICVVDYQFCRNDIRDLASDVPGWL